MRNFLPFDRRDMFMPEDIADIMPTVTLGPSAAMGGSMTKKKTEPKDETERKTSDTGALGRVLLRLVANGGDYKAEATARLRSILAASGGHIRAITKTLAISYRQTQRLLASVDLTDYAAKLRGEAGTSGPRVTYKRVAKRA